MTLTWATNASQERNRIYSNRGHVITGARDGYGKVFYNAWVGEPHESKHLECGYEAEGLA